MVQKPNQTQHLGVTGRARRSPMLQQHKSGGDHRAGRDAGAAKRGDDYELPLVVAQVGDRRKVTLKTTGSVNSDGELVMQENSYLAVAMFEYVTSSTGWDSTGSGLVEFCDDPLLTAGQYRIPVELDRYDEVRFSMYVAVNPVALGTCTLQLRYSTSNSGGTLSDIDTDGTPFNINVSDSFLDTGWQPLVGGARVPVAYITVEQNFSISPSVSGRITRVTAEFRAKPAV